MLSRTSRIEPSTRNPRFSNRFKSFAVALLALSAVSCASEGSYVWFTKVPRAEWGAPPSRYLIGVGDMVDISVYGEAGLHAAGKIRRDGRIAVPLVGEVE